MALGAGISAFVNGLVAGEDIEHRWQDRKDNKARQKKLDEYRADAEKRLAERHGWDRTNHGIYVDQAGRVRTEWEQGQADRSGIRDALSQADDATMAAMNAPPEAQDTATVSTKSPALGVQPDGQLVPPVSPEAQGVAAELGLDFGGSAPVQAQPVPTASTAPAQPQAQASLGAVRPTQPQAGADPLFQNLPDGRVVALRPGRTPDERALIAAAAQEGRLAMSNDRQEAQQQIDRDGPVPYEYGQPGMAGRDVRQATRTVADVAGNAVAGWGEQVINSGVDTMQRVNAPFQAASRWITGEDRIGAPDRVDLNRDGQTPSLESPVGDAVFGKRETAPTPENASPQEAQVSVAAQDAMDKVGQSPSQQATANSMPVGMGATKSKPMTKPQQKAAAKTYTDTWMQVGAPIYQRELLKQGRIDDAKAMDEWMRTADARKGMEAFSEATFAAMTGDADTAAKKIIEAYNSTGYFDDGYEIVEEQSELIRNGKGEVVGLKLAMRNQATGEVHESVDEIDDLLNKALYLVSPEKAFEAAIGRQKAMAEALVKADEERRAARTELIKEDYKNGAEAELEAYKATVFPNGLPPMDENGNVLPIPSLEEWRAQQYGSAASGTENPPVLRP